MERSDYRSPRLARTGAGEDDARVTPFVWTGAHRPCQCIQIGQDGLQNRDRVRCVSASDELPLVAIRRRVWVSEQKDVRGHS